ncbi:MAG: transglutaminase domain-containing protein [Anaerolineae bacterium]
MLPELELREGWVTVFCLLLVFLCVAWGIQAAEWAEGLSVLQGAVLVGGLAGIVLAKSRVPNRLAHVLSLVAGLAWSAYLTSQTMAHTLDMSWRLALVELDANLQHFFFAIFQGGSGANNYVFVLLLAFSLWIMAYFGGWAVFRWQRVWWAVIVAGVALLLNVNYAQEDLTLYIILFLLAGLLLVVRANVAVYEQEWRRLQVGYSSEMISSVLQAGLVISVVAILVAWMAPSVLASRPLQPFWDKVAEPWRKLQERSAQVFQDLNYNNPAPLQDLRGRRTFFGGPVNLPDTPVADIDAPAGRFWRVGVFHDYAGNGWVSDDPDMLLIEAGKQELAFPAFDLRYEITQTVRIHDALGPGQPLIAAGQPLRASLPLRAAVSLVTQQEDLVRLPESGVFPSRPGDPSVLYSRQPLAADEPYQVLSSISEADKQSLREAGTNYPEWVTPRYLQLPDSLPERVRLLAEQITSGIETPHDKAEAIESYLRQIPYTQDIPGPAPGQDGVDYFLFEEQKGYCDYYASSMVVMLRAVGVPARYVRGYAHRDKEQGLYSLLQSDAHAWPEVFFPGYGWVEFEPTPAQPVVGRQDSREMAGAGPEFFRDPEDMPQMRDEMMGPDDGRGLGAINQKPGWVLFCERFRGLAWVLLVLGSLGLAAIAAFRIYREHQIEGLSSAERVYAELVSWVRRLLRLEPLAHQTPHEYASVVVEAMPGGRGAVERITSFYVEERFGNRQVEPEPAVEAWQEAWSAMWRRWFEQRTYGLRRLWWKIIPPKNLAEEE